MKSLHSKLSGIAPFVFFPLLVIFLKRKFFFYVFAFLVLVSLSSCFLNFYRTRTKPSIDEATMAKLNSEDKYFIIHFPGIIKGLENVFVKGDTISGKLVTLPGKHSKFLYPDSSNNAIRIKAIDKKDALIEVHLYTNADPKNNDSIFSAASSSFNRADVYELNKSATNANHIISTVGTVVGAVLVISLVALTIACNCPQVYVSNNGAYNFTSGLYSGAVYSTLERMDYLPLTSVPADAQNISFKIANAKDEEQYINQVQLLQVNHLQGINVLQDRYGNILSYQSITSPLTASIDKKNDVKNLLEQTDGKYYSFDNSANKNGFSDLILSFDKPENADKAKLMIHARNTYWGGLLHKDFISLFGDKYEKWREKQEKADPEKLQKWQTDQALPLMVYIKTTSGWKLVDYFPLIGNTASRDMIMEINTQGIKQSKVEIKLETTYRFWDLDFAGIDYSATQNFTKNIIQPLHATKSDGTDQTELLINSDKQYTHLTGDEAISFDYSVPAATGNTVSSYFLVSGGYYHSLEHITGKANLIELYKFRKKGAFDKFSRQKYQEVEEVAAMMKKSQ